MGQAFKSVPQAEALWRSGDLPPEVFQRHGAQLKERNGVQPHVLQVWQSIVIEFAKNERAAG